MNARTAACALAAALVTLLAGCSSATQPAAPGSSTDGTDGNGTVTVLAAASLTEAFTQIGNDFEARHAGSTVTFSFGSSATLATQIVQGAPADVFAAASSATMETAAAAGAAQTPTNFVSNTLRIAVPKGNPHKITGLEDFADGSKRMALCAPQVPCGAVATKVFAVAKIVPKPDTLEQDVKAAVQKVASDEVDAALVYKTDVLAAGDKVDGIEFAEAQEAINTYPIATLTKSKNPELAKAFVDYVLSSDGQAVLAEAGFAKP
ncbi:MAG TPA: molybdate ABC transporter substrate-binding protein [Propionibacteriaceae bacterium]|jgi:molybdate transport system substrate-binding protein|nr:molybdate ABC transporter substrate-binding protein [Propionibacteriaceae bacterium]